MEENGTKQQKIGRHAIPWSTIFLFDIWLIWKHRNQLVFKEQRPNPHLAKEISCKALRYNFYVGPHKEAITRICKPIRWSKSVSGWVKLNTDGSSLGNPGLVGGGGLIRDKEGN